MNEPLRVQVVRPRKDLASASAALVGVVAGAYFLNAYFVMQLVPFIVPAWNLGYWQAFAAVALVRGIPRIDYLSWTQSAPKKSKKSSTAT